MNKVIFAFFVLLLYAGQPQAQITSIAGPAGSGDFGYSVTTLSNGNYVITDPYYIDGPVMNAGAVYLYDGRTHILISTLKGKNNYDFVGMDGVIALKNGNFVVLSYNVDNGPIVNCGAITWVDGVTGLSGVITSANSLFGTATNDRLGSGGIVSFDNGNYAVISPEWDNGSVVNAGAVTLLNGAAPAIGLISVGNSLVGASINDQVGVEGIVVLDNNNFLVRSFSWDNGVTVNAGAITWCNGLSPTTGLVSSTNSLVGTSTDDFLGISFGVFENRVVKLTNGNFVIVTPGWDNAGILDAGAVTWGSNIFGVSGIIGSNNSLVGTSDYEQVGGGEGDIAGVVALSNGNYVVASPWWNNASGAVTWGNGTSGITGNIDSTNSLVGGSVGDEIGSSRGGWCGVVPLTNGNYVVGSAFWNNGSIEDVGAVTLGNGLTGIIGEVTPANSLVGSSSFDFIEYGSGYQIKMITPLSNGHYVVSTPNWDNGMVINAGAVTWANGNTGITGEINSSKSLVGSITNDEIGYVTALPNGNYVVCSPYWDNDIVVDAGAVTWADGNIGIVGSLNSSNSLVGSHTNDNIGGANEVIVLNNGNYVIRSQYWDNGTVTDAGAATWGNGTTGITGAVSSSNSLVGNTTGDRIANNVIALANGNYVVSSPVWSDGSLVTGAATWGNGSVGIKGPISRSNSLVGSHMTDYVGGWILPLSNGNYLVVSQEWDNTGPNSAKGAVTWGNGLTGISGEVTSNNSLVGSVAGDFVGNEFLIAEDNYITASRGWDNGGLTDAGAVTLLGPGTSAVSGTITNCNSVLGNAVNSGSRLQFAGNKLYGYLLVSHATDNIVNIFDPVGMTLANAVDSALVTLNGNSPVPLLTSDGCHIIATLTPNGVNPVSGIVKAKLWREATVPEQDGHPFVSRHYEITPSSNATTSTGRITLYFTQQEFDDFNAHAGSTSDLPVNNGDSSGISKLRIIKYPGVSNDNTGLPGSYSGTPVLIDPAKQDIVWNSSLNRWEVSFDVTGFSGFIVQTNIPLLPLTLLEFKGRLTDHNALLEWTTTDEFNTNSFDVERSTDGRIFTTVGSVAAFNQPGIHLYDFTDLNISSLGAPVVYYRLKLTDIDGRFTYSNIITLAIDNKNNIVFYPNPVMDNAILSITFTEPDYLRATIIDNVGRVVRQQQWNVVRGNTSLPVNVSKLAGGMYFLALKGKTLNRRIQFVKL